MVAATSGAPPPAVFALDFDGVACDSVGESSLSAWKAATKLWPEVFSTSQAEARRNQVLEGMRAVRPVVETGYENVVQVRCLLEGVRVEDMLARWHDMLPEYMARWGLDRSNLVQLFGSTRDEWIESDLEGWLAPNRVYDGVPEAMRALMAQHEVYIVTTKQAHFTEMILRQMAGISFPPDRIFSQTVSGRPKSEVLEALQARHPGSAHHFVEDKLGTLEKSNVPSAEKATGVMWLLNTQVERVEALAEWRLHFVTWGYSTAEEKARAAANPRINVLSSAAELQRLGEVE